MKVREWQIMRNSVGEISILGPKLERNQKLIVVAKSDQMKTLNSAIQYYESVGCWYMASMLRKLEHELYS